MQNNTDTVRAHERGHTSIRTKNREVDGGGDIGKASKGEGTAQKKKLLLLV